VRKFGVFCAALLLTGGVAFAETSAVPVPGAEDWTFFTDNADKRCFAATSYKSGIGLAFVADPRAGWGLMVVDARWTIPSSSNLPIYLVTDKKKWSLQARVTDDGHGLLMNALKDEFITDMSMTKHMRLYNASKAEVAGFEMSGSAKALKMVGTCSEIFKADLERNPFGGQPSQSATNPFNRPERGA
jgi:hypothetical protein